MRVERGGGGKRPQKRACGARLQGSIGTLSSRPRAARKRSVGMGGGGRREWEMSR